MEFNTKDIIIYSTLVILVILVIYILVRQKKNSENFDVTNNNNISAITNLGNIAAQMMAPNAGGVSGQLIIPADNTIFNGSLTASALSQSFINLVLPTGLILAWNNAGSIPTGWILCDGNNNTPNLQGRFILGAGQGGNDMNGIALPLQTFGTTGGEVNHTLVIAEMPYHNHTTTTYDGGNALIYGTYNGSNNNGTTGSTGGNPNNNNITDPHNNMPPYYVLVYIMKL